LPAKAGFETWERIVLLLVFYLVTITWQATHLQRFISVTQSCHFSWFAAKSGSFFLTDNSKIFNSSQLVFLQDLKKRLAGLTG